MFSVPPPKRFGLIYLLAWFKGRTEPDPKADVTVEFDGRQVVVPVGKPIQNPKLKDHGGQTSFSQSEYLLYKESQCRIRYVLKMEFCC